MTYRRDMLSGYLKRLFLQREWTDDFLQYLSGVGQRHTSKLGSASINVDYMHINALLGYLEHLLIDVLCNADNTDEKTKRGILMAVNKLFWIQNDFFTMHYLMSLKDHSTSNKKSEKNHTSKCCWA